MRPIRVLVVDDSIVFRELLVQNLNKDPAIQVVGTAKDPFEARDAILSLKPDVMTLDIELPRMSGIEFLQKLMPQYPLPVIVISSLSEKVFDAMNAGAVDFVAKPVVANRMQLEEFIRNELLVKIKIASTAKISNIKKVIRQREEQHLKVTDSNLIVAIGASTGGTEAIFEVVKEFGTDIPGIVVVQHMPPGFTAMYAKRLNDQCRIQVKEAETGDIPSRCGGCRCGDRNCTPRGGRSRTSKQRRCGRPRCSHTQWCRTRTPARTPAGRRPSPALPSSWSRRSRTAPRCPGRPFWRRPLPRPGWQWTGRSPWASGCWASGAQGQASSEQGQYLGSARPSAR